MSSTHLKLSITISTINNCTIPPSQTNIEKLQETLIYGSLGDLFFEKRVMKPFTWPMKVERM